MAGAGRQSGYLLTACQGLANDGMEVVAICDRIEAHARRRAEQFGIPAVYAGDDAFERMLERERLDGVFVVTPHATHAPLATAAMEMGVDVYDEKPMADSLDACRGLVAAAERHRRTLGVGYLYSVWAQWAGVVVGDDAIGSVRGGQVRWTRADDLQTEEFYLAPGSGVVRDLIGHQWTMLHPVLRSRPISVTATGSREAVLGRYGPHCLGYDTVSAEIACADGVVVKIDASHADGGPATEEIEMIVHGDRGRLDYQFPGPRSDVRALRPVVRPRGGDARLGPPPDIYNTVAERFIGNWHRASQGLEPLLFTAHDALATECVLDAIAQAIETGGPVNVAA